MRKLFGYKKGQWFIISAIIASGALLAMSFIFRGYFITDTSVVQLNDESYNFYTIKDSIKDIENNNDCTDLSKSMTELDNFLRDKFISKGILFRLIYDTNCPGASTVNTRLLLLQSDNMEIWDGDRTEIDTIISSGGTAEINIKQAVNYPIIGRVEVFAGYGQTLLGEHDFTILQGATQSNSFSATTGNFAHVLSPVLLGKKTYVVD